jgi:hypothetical protein
VLGIVVLGGGAELGQPIGAVVVLVGVAISRADCGGGALGLIARLASRDA